MICLDLMTFAKSSALVATTYLDVEDESLVTSDSMIGVTIRFILYVTQTPMTLTGCFQQIPPQNNGNVWFYQTIRGQ